MDKEKLTNRMDNKVCNNRLDELIEGRKSPLIPNDFYCRPSENNHFIDDSDNDGYDDDKGDGFLELMYG